MFNYYEHTFLYSPSTLCLCKKWQHLSSPSHKGPASVSVGKQKESLEVNTDFNIGGIETLCGQNTEKSPGGKPLIFI